MRVLLAIPLILIANSAVAKDKAQTNVVQKPTTIIESPVSMDSPIQEIKLNGITIRANPTTIHMRPISMGG